MAHFYHSRAVDTVQDSNLANPSLYTSMTTRLAFITSICATHGGLFARRTSVAAGGYLYEAESVIYDLATLMYLKIHAAILNQR